MSTSIDATHVKAAPHDVWVAGVDEVGRGCLAGPVVAAAVILDPDQPLAGLRDSKALSPRRREHLDILIRTHAVAHAIGMADPGEIDCHNILQATFMAMRRAVGGLPVLPSACLVDGNQDPGLGRPTRVIVGGDRIEPAIMAASIIAKVARDALMGELEARHPGYGFAAHKGYGTSAHLVALGRLGPSPQHRLSFAPCRAAQQAAAGTARGLSPH